jgi:hypothetical protein
MERVTVGEKIEFEIRVGELMPPEWKRVFHEWQHVRITVERLDEEEGPEDAPSTP